MQRMLRARNALLPVVVVFVGLAAARSQQTVSGIRFSVDTTETKAPAAGLLSTFSGRVEFGAGRGRIDVSSVASRPTRSVNDVTVGTLLAQPGDYYLFDTTGYILIRPSNRTFSTVSFAASTYRHGNIHEPWDGFFEFGTERREDLPPSDTSRVMQHGPYGVRWHLDRLMPAGPAEILARGRTLVVDSPRGEVSVLRWMAVSAALATLRDSITPLDSALRLTAVAVLPPQPGASGETNLILLHQMSAIRSSDIDLARLVLPAEYTEAPWRGFEHVADLPVRRKEAAKHWLTLRPSSGGTLNSRAHS